MGIFDLIEELGEREEKITDYDFISPIIHNNVVATRIDKLVYTFMVPKVAPGWYKIKPIDNKNAKIVGEADYLDISSYLGKLDRIRLTIVIKRKNVYLGIPDKSNKYGFPVQDLLPVYLHDDTVLDFDRVIARYDGINIWFESTDINNDPLKSDYLRDSLVKYLSPSSLKFEGLTVEDKMSYSLRHTLDKELKKEKKEYTLKEDVEHAGGQFIKYTELSDSYRVTYRVDGQEYTSSISKNPDRKVVSAGICLNGNDKLFNLKSLITVVREGQERDLIHRW